MMVKRLLVLFFTVVGLSTFTTSCGGEGNVSIPGVQGPNINILEDNLIVSMVMENVNLIGGATYKVPKYKNSYIMFNPNLEGPGAVLSFTVSLDDLFDDDVTELDPKTLPGGRMIPGVAAGALPAVAFSVEKLKNMAFYVGPKIFGIWVPLPKFDLYGFGWTQQYKVGSRRVGNISLFGKDANGENAGFFLALSVKSSQEKMLKRQAEKY